MSQSSSFPSDLLRSNAPKKESPQKVNLDITNGTLSWRNLSLIDNSARFHNVSGYVKPKEMLAVIGGPGSGVKELLEVLTRRVKTESNITVHGEILLNGTFPGQKYRSMVAYIPKTENHLALLTVRETLEFAARIRAPRAMSDADIQSNVDAVLKWLDMDDERIQNTKVGDATIKGISGGQKRRLSIGVEAVSGYAVLVADLPTNGLDAKTAYSVVESAKRVANAGKAMIMSLVQPSPELFDLFDNVLVLSHGEMIYFGPQNKIEEYFNSLGFTRPEEKSLPAWIEEISDDPRKYYEDQQAANIALHKSMIESFSESTHFAELGQFLWSQSNRQLDDIRDLEDMEERSWLTIDASAKAFGKIVAVPKPIGWCQKMHLCYKRAFMVQSRNKQVLYFRAFQAILIAIIQGIIWLQLGKSDYQSPGEKGYNKTRSRIGFCFFTIGFMGFGAVPFIPGLANNRSVFYYQRDSGYFSTSAYYLATVLSELPFTLLETLVYSVIVYLMSYTPEKYVYLVFFYYFCFTVRFISWSACMSAVGLLPNAMTAQIVASAILPIMFAFNGFLVPTKVIPSAMMFMNRISFFAPAFKSLAHLELFDIERDGEGWRAVTQYDIVDPDHNSSADASWVAGVGALLWVWFLFFNGLAMITLACLNYDRNDLSYIQYLVRLYRWVRGKVEFLAPDSGFHDAMAVPLQEEEIERAGVTIEWKDLNYTVEVKGKEILLLDQVNGYVKPGEMVALMGPSGAGKSTLLDILADKKNTGKIDGQILVNGKPKDEYFQRFMGYVEQFDSHMDTFTVYEAVQFSAEMRLDDSYSAQQRKDLVIKTLDQLGLTHVADLATQDITQEQRKKTTIAVELVAQPDLLFLDEPTTGLDSGAALSIMQIVKQLVEKEKLTVICTIHQPSANVYKLFDNIVLLKSNPGGTAYFGPCSELNAYYEREGFGVSPEDKNPADWALEALDNVEDANVLWKNSKEFAKTYEDLTGGVHVNNPNFPQFSRRYARGAMTQFKALLVRASKMFWRDRAGQGLRISMALLLGTLFGLLYLDFKKRLEKNNQSEFFTILNQSFVFLCIVYATESAAQEIPQMVSERPMLYREIDSKLYSFAMYYLSRWLAQLPWILFQSLCFLLIFFIGRANDFDARYFFLFYFGFTLMLSLGTSISQMFSICTPTDSAGNVLYTTFCTLMRMMAGFLTFVSVMQEKLGGFAQFMNFIDFFKYGVFYLASIYKPNWDGEKSVMNTLQKSEWPSQIIGGEVGWTVYLFGIFIFIVVVHLISVLVLTFKRWDER